MNDRWKIYIHGGVASRLPWQAPAPASRIPGLLGRLRAAGWALPPASAEAGVASLEEALGVPFPSDYRLFLAKAGGVPPEGPWRGLWSLDQVRSLNRSLPVFEWFGGLVGIGNEGFVVHALDYRGGGSPPVVCVGISASDPEEIEFEAESFSDWLEGTLEGA